MRTFIYALQTVLKRLWLEKWINLLTILSISIGLLILSAFVTVTLNLDSVLKRWAKSFGVVVYVAEKTSAAQERSLKNYFEQDPDVLEVKYISKEKAFKALRKTLGADADILGELNENPLPSSFELKLRKELLEPALVEQKAVQIKQMSGVDEVQYGEKWLTSLNTISKIMKISASFLGGAIFIAIIFITYNTIKIFFYRRKDEIETLKLLGATRGFIRLPFLMEAIYFGIMGGIISSLALYGIQSLITFKGIQFLPSIRTIIVSLPYQVYFTVPLAGALMSLIGSFIAVGRIKY